MKTETVSVRVEDLKINLENPRHVPQYSQIDAIKAIFNNQGMKLLRLAEDIVEKGLNPADLPLITESDEKKQYIVLEGNRRIVALKLLLSTDLLKSIGLSRTIIRRYNELSIRGESTLPKSVNCVVTSREDANHWIHLRHTGENKGVGIVPWDGVARQRFRGSSPALQVINLIEKTNYINESTRKGLENIFITNIERLVNTPEARKKLGIDIKKKKLEFLIDKETALKRLAIVVTDIVNRNIKVSDLDTRDQRIEYASEICDRLPSGLKGDEQIHSKIDRGQGGTTIKTKRKFLIPSSLKLGDYKRFCTNFVT